MVNKKILFLIFAGIFFVLLLNSFVSADWNQKVDWNGNAFDWYNPGDTHNREYGVYSSLYQRLACDENSDFSVANCQGAGTDCKNHGDYDNSFFYYMVWNNNWLKTKCIGSSHDVGKHFANPSDSRDDGNWDNPYSPALGAWRTCIDSDGDVRASAVSPHSGGGTLESVCGVFVESVSCDRDSSTSGIYSVSTEICGDGKDNDCNGAVDNGCDCIYGSSPSRSCDAPGECSFGTQTCTQPGQWSPCSIAPTTETCDGKDNNCDGAVDANNLDLIICYRDKDKDRFGMSSVEGSDNSAWFPKDACSSLDYDYCPRVTSNAYWDNYDASYRERWIDDWSSGTGDCDNDNSKIFPNAPELCDGKDNQCSGNTGYGQIDENPNTICQSNPPFASGQICHSGTCGTPRVYWASDSAGATEIITPPNLIAYPPSKTVYLVLEYPPFISSNREWKFEIYEKDYSFNSNDNIRVGEDALIGTITGNKIIATWTITQADIDKAKPLIGIGVEDPFDFYFRMYDAEKPGGGGGGGVPPAEIILGLKKSITGKSITGFYTFKSTGPEENKYLKISWIEEGQTQPQPATCTDGIKNQDETGIDCGGSICSACISQPLQIDCTQYLKCSDLSKTQCEEGTIADSCQLGPQNINCNDPNTNCGCSWNGATCGSFFISTDINGNSLGTCNFQEGIPTKTCASDGVLEYLTTATWSVNEETGPASCTSSTVGPIICSAKTRLPLESKFGILLTILVIVLGYLFLRGEKNK